MAAKLGWTVCLDRDRLAVARTARGATEWSEWLPCEREQTSETATTITHLLEERGYTGQPVLVALGSDDVVSTTIAAPTRKALKRSAMAFLVEPALPWSVEESVIDYERIGTDRAFVVAAEAVPLRELILALAEKGIQVASVVPAARLALSHHLQNNPRLAPRYLLGWGHDEHVDLWLIVGDQPVTWRWAPEELPPVARAIKQIALCEGNDLVLAGRNLPDEFLKSLSEMTGLAVHAVQERGSEDPFDCCAQQAAALLAGRGDPPIELCRDQLAPSDRYRSIRRELRVLQASLLVLLVTLGVALTIQGNRIESLRGEAETRQSELFQSLVPKQKVPVAIVGRLQNEVARLKGVRGESTDLPTLMPYADLMERLLQALPEGLRFRLFEVRLNNGQLYLVGQVRAHGDADRIAEGLRAKGLEVASPSTQRLEKEGVEFRISARLAPPPTKKPAGRST
jgi:type II secretory pathway component PulL